MPFSSSPSSCFSAFALHETLALPSGALYRAEGEQARLFNDAALILIQRRRRRRRASTPPATC